MEASLFRIAPFHAVNGDEVSMCVHHLRLKAQGRFESERCALAFARASQRDAEIEMSHREAMQKTYGAQCTVDRLLILSHSPVGGRKTEKSAGVIFVEGERSFESCDGILQLREPQVGLAELEISAWILRRCCFRFQQSPQCPTQIAARQFHSRPKQLTASRVRFFAIGDRAKQAFGLCQIPALEVTGS